MVAVESYSSLAQAEVVWRKFIDEGVWLPYQSFDLVKAWYATLDDATDTQPCLLAVYDQGGSPLLFLPLGIIEERGFGTRWRVVRLLPGPDVADYMAPVVTNRASTLSEHEARAMWRKIVRALPDADLLRFENVPGVICGVPNPLLRVGLPFRHLKNAMLTELKPDWDAYYNSKMKKSRRSNSRRRLRRLSEFGSVVFKAVEDPDEREHVVETLIRQKRRWVIDSGLRDGLIMDNYPEFYQEMARLCHPRVRVSMLAVDDEIIATDFSIAVNKILYGVKNSNAGGQWLRYAPGILLMEWVLRQAVDDGFKQVNFGTGTADYIKEWCETSVPLYEAEIRLSARARLASLPRAAKRQLEVVVQRSR